MALYNLTQGGLVNALDSQQIINLLTGNMTDQQVTIGNRIQASLAGSTNSSGYVGGTVSGAPASGAHSLGDFITDYTNGTLWVCTAAGTPGTWLKVGDYLLSSANTWTLAQTFSSAAAFNAGLTSTTGVFSGDVDAKTFEATGAASLSNAQSGRFVGSWTTIGAPAGLTAEVADYGLDGNGNIWFCSAAGTPGTWRPSGSHVIDEQSPSAAASVRIPPSGSLSTGYKHLRITAKLKSSTATNSENLVLRFNGDNGSNYFYGYLLDNGGAASAAESNSSLSTGMVMGNIPGTTAPANSFGHYIITIFDFNSGSDFKVVHFQSMNRLSTGAAAIQFFTGTAGWVIAPTAVTNMTLLAIGNVTGTVITEGFGY